MAGIDAVEMSSALTFRGIRQKASDIRLSRTRHGEPAQLAKVRSVS